MVSPELLRRYPFFAGLDIDQITELAKVGEELAVEEEHVFFHEGEELDGFYLVVEGEVGIVMALTDRAARHTVSEQFARDLKTKDVVVSTVGEGEVFGWSGLLPPHTATAGAKVLEPGRVVTFDCTVLLPQFEDDCRFGYLMIQKAAQVIRQRLQDIRLESLAQMVA